MQLRTKHLFILLLLALSISATAQQNNGDVITINKSYKLSVATNIPGNFIRESIQLKVRKFGVGFTASRSMEPYMLGYQFDADVRGYLSKNSNVKNEFFLYGRFAHTKFTWDQPSINMNLHNQIYQYGAIGFGYRHSFGKRKNLFYELSLGIKPYTRGMVSYKNDSIIPQGMSLVEGRFLLGYQFKYEKTKQLTHEQLQNRANHKVSLSNPLSAMAKVRMRYEIQRHNTGLLVAGSVNYFAIDNSGLDSTQHKTKVGWQVYLEGRQYLDERRSSFIYGKLGKGQSTMYDYSMNHHGYYTYSLVGGGYGRCIKMSPRFFFEFNVGAKYCFGNNEFTRDYRESASLVGAMSIIDLNMHLGLYLSQINTSVEEDYHSGEHVHLSRRWKKVLKVIFLPWLW